MILLYIYSLFVEKEEEFKN